MIIGRINDLVNYKAIPYLDYIISFLKESDLKRIGLGEHTLEHGIIFQKKINKTNYPKDKLFKSHEKKIDIYIVIEGEEDLYYADVDSNRIEVEREYDIEEDVTLYKGEPDLVYHMQENTFAALFPNDAHKSHIKDTYSNIVIGKFIIKLE